MSNGREVLEEFDGFEATRRIHSMFEGKQHPRIIAHTASALKEDVERCYEYGMDGFIAQPLTLPSLMNALKENFKKEQAA